MSDFSNGTRTLSEILIMGGYATSQTQAKKMIRQGYVSTILTCTEPNLYIPVNDPNFLVKFHGSIAVKEERKE